MRFNGDSLESTLLCKWSEPVTGNLDVLGRLSSAPWDHLGQSKTLEKDDDLLTTEGKMRKKSRKGEDVEPTHYRFATLHI
ncbi:hypothetical protein MRX96_019050 [Rhipicephalus microplus]